MLMAVISPGEWLIRREEAGQPRGHRRGKGEWTSYLCSTPQPAYLGVPEACEQMLHEAWVMSK